MQLACQKMPASKNNFWWVKPFKYNDLPCWDVDEGACQLSDDVRILTKASKNREG